MVTPFGAPLEIKTKLQTIRTSMNGWNQIRVSTQDYMICPQQCCICWVTRDGFSYVMFISRMIYYVDGSGLLFWSFLHFPNIFLEESILQIYTSYDDVMHVNAM